MPIGAHVSTAGGLSTCVGRAQGLGAECMQIFLSAPQRWQQPRHTDEQVLEFTRQLAALSPAEFMSALDHAFDVRRVVCGPDFAFGNKRAGNRMK